MRKSLSTTLVMTLTALLLVIPTFSHATDISDVPMAVSSGVKPNVMLTIDDSGSMQFEVLPESDKVFLTFPRPTTLYRSTYYDYGSFDHIVRFDIANKYARCYRNAQCNAQYYDPAKLYRPWSQADGSLMTNATATAACHNPYRCSGDASEGTINLTADQNAERNWVNDDGTDTSETVTFYPATYFKFTPAGTAPTAVDDANNLQANYTKIEIKAVNAAQFTKSAARTDCAGTTCTYNEEIQNFANWYSYYRSRILAARAGIGRAFAKQDSDSMRVGFAAINKGSTTIDNVATSTVVSGVRSFSGTARTDFFTSLYDHAMPRSGTPLRKAMGDVGEYFSRTDDAGPWGETPGSSGGTQHACRQNYQIIMTDGYWNGDGATNGTGNQDNADGAEISRPAGSTLTPATYQYTPANPYSDSYSNTLADVAMYYWKRDLRSSLDNIVPTTTENPAFWQHMVNFTVGFGVTGTIPKASIDWALTGAPNTDPPTIITWTDPTSSDAHKVDDLAHAAVNSRGGYFNAADPDEFSEALSDALDSVIARNGSAAAVAVANANVTSGDNASYASSYNSGSWTGDLQSFPIDVTTGNVDTSSPTWTTSAQTQLDLRSSASRYLVSYSGTSGTSQGRPFQAAGCGNAAECLSSAQQARLATPYTPPGTSDGAAVLAYLRGDRSGETAQTYRSRAHLLGDIINAEPLIIREPMANYADVCYKAAKTGKCTTPFKTAQASRTKIVAQGANDGFVHMFNATTGAESWAYLPNLLIDMSDPSNAGTSTLNILSRRSSFAHKYFVDGTPVLGDVDFSNTDGVSGNPDPNWRTIIVGGLGKGGRGYYALDVTSPNATSEADAASKVLWEFPNSATTSTIKANIGYTYGKPVITKTAKYGWVVLVTSGYNNGTGADNSGGTGRGYLWVLNARTGAVLQTIDTGAGSTTTPAGLAHISGWTDNGDIDNTTTYVYGGDLLGNVWRFDLTPTGNPGTYTAQRLAKLRSGASATDPVQPVTTVPELAAININGSVKRFVYIGTGLYLGTNDVVTNQTQSMYGLVDDLSEPLVGDVIADPIRSSLVGQTLTVSGANRTASSATIDFTTKKGWYIDLPGCSLGTCPEAGSKGSERVNTDPTLVSGVLVFTSNIPSADPCLPGGSSFINFVDYLTGGTVSGATYASIGLGNTLASRPVIIKLPSGGIRAIVRPSEGDPVTITPPIPPTTMTAGRVTWRELTE